MSLVGTEVLQVTGADNLGRPSGSTEVITVNNLATFVTTAPTIIGGTIIGATIVPAPFAFIDTPSVASVGTVLTGTAISGGYIIRSGPTAAFTDTTDTAANIISALNLIGSVPVGFSSALTIKNNTNFVESLSAGSNVSFSGTLNANPSIAPNCEAFFLVTPASANSVGLALSAMGNGTTGINQTQYTAISNTANTLLTSAQMAGGALTTINMTGALGSSASLSTATAASLLPSIPNVTIGTSYALRIINSSTGAFAWNLAANTGISISGTASISQNTWRDFYVTVNSASSVALQSIGVGTYS